MGTAKTIKGRRDGEDRTFSITGLAKEAGVTEHFVRSRYNQNWAHQKIIDAAFRDGKGNKPDTNKMLQSFCLGKHL